MGHKIGTEFYFSETERCQDSHKYKDKNGHCNLSKETGFRIENNLDIIPWGNRTLKMWLDKNCYKRKANPEELKK